MKKKPDSLEDEAKRLWKIAGTPTCTKKAWLRLARHVRRRERKAYDKGYFNATDKYSA